MGRLYPRMRERPPEFRINPENPLWRDCELIIAATPYGQRIACDLSPTQNHGRMGSNLAIAPVWVQELRRFGYRFSGGSLDGILPARSPNLVPAHGNWTFMAWINPKPALVNTIVDNRYSGDDAGFMCYTGSAGGYKFNFDLNDSTTFHYYRNAYGPVLTNQLSFIILVVARSQNTAWYYCNGVQYATIDISATSGSVNTGHNKYRIGGHANRSEFAYYGMATDVMHVNRCLSPAEISALADPSNVDLRVGGVPLILPPRRRFFPSVEIHAPTFNPAWAQHVNTYIGLGR